MNAWQAFDAKLSLSLIPVPTLGPDDEVVRVSFAGICGSDVAKLTKELIPDPGRPWTPGHEIVGTDAAGHEVVVDPLVSCGACARCRAGEINLCPDLEMIGWHRPGGFSEYVAVPRRNAIPLQAGLPAARAVLTEPTAVAVHGVRCGVPIKPPGRLAVVGAGTLAIASAAYAATLGWDVTIFARSAAKSTRGLAHAVEVSTEPPQPRAYDVVIDAAAGRDDLPFVTALDAVRDGGVIVVQTAYHPGVKFSRDLRDLIRRAVAVRGSFSFCRQNGRDDFTEAMRFLTDDGLWADPLVGDRFALERLPDALNALIHRDRSGISKAILCS